MQLLERNPELARAGRALGGAVDGDGRVLAIAGPPGIGKTELLADLRRQAGEAGARVCVARGAPLEHEFVFGVARQLLEPVLQRAASARRRRLLAGAAHLVEPLLTELPDPRCPSEADRGFTALHGLYWLVANLAEEGPLVLAVDDAHWADEASLRFLAHLSGRLEGLAVLVAVTFRPEDPGADTEALHAVQDDPRATLVRPGPLTPEAVHQLVGDDMGRDAHEVFSAACHRATGGNPFLVRELVAALADDAVAPVAAKADRVADLGPASIGRVVLARLARSSSAATALARAVVVLGVDASLHTAARLARLDPEVAAEAADALVAAHVLRAGQPLDFVHPVVRAAVYEDLAPRVRADAHARAARLCAEDAGGEEAVAAHLLVAPPAGDDWVVSRLRAAAADARAKGVPEVAVTYLERALSEPPPPAERPAVLTELGTAHAARHEAKRSIDTLTEALATAHEPRRRAVAAQALAGMLVLRPGSAGGAVELLDAAARDLPAEERELGLALEAAIAGSSFVSLDALRAAAERRPRFSGDLPAQRAHDALRHAMYVGPAHESMRLARRALGGGRLLAAEGPESPTFWEGVLALLFSQDLAGAHAAATEALAHATRAGSLVGVGLASCFRARASAQLGALREAEADGRAYVDLLGDTLGMGPAFLVDALVARGDLAAARELVDACPAVGDRTDLSMFHFLLLSRARLHLAAGETDRALGELDECGRGLSDWDAVAAGNGGRTPGSIQWRPLAAEALAQAEDRSAARGIVDQALESCRSFGAPTCLGPALVAAGLVEGGERGIELLAEAEAVLAPSPARLEHARALVEVGAATRRAGHRSAARGPLQAGLASARRCGATPLAERAHDELVATGARPRKIVRTGVDALTATERRVAELAARGLSNREIAQSLFVSTRTVETHLGRVYQKLGVGSRRGLAHSLAGATS